MVCCIGLLVGVSWAQQTINKSAADAMKAGTQTKVISCINQVTIPIQFDANFLKGNVENTGLPENVNNVLLTITNSNLSGDMVRCFYKSQNGDIPNLVYKVPCKNGKKGGTSYEHSYTCVK
jgi:hypothetical protein